MKKILLSLLIAFASLSATANKQYILTAGRSILNLTTSDTFVFKSSIVFQYTYFGQVHGTAGHPFVILNEGGQTKWDGGGITLENCTYGVIDGTGAAGVTYGIKIQNAGNLINLKGKFSNIEIKNVEGYNSGVGGGIWAKCDVGYVQSDYGCDSSYLYPYNQLLYVSVHNSYFHKIKGDCFYFGDTDPYGVSRTINCWGGWVLRRPAQLGYIDIYNNIIDEVDRQGIQISGGYYGHNHIHHNTLTNIGVEFNSSQGTGIFVGGGTKDCEVDHNIISKTWMHGIWSYGIGTTLIHDNIIDSTGILYGTRAGHGLTSTGWQKVGQYSYESSCNCQSYNGDHTVWDMSPIYINTYSNPSTETSTFQVIDNQSGWSTDRNNNVVAIDDGAHILTQTGNIVCNNTGGGVYAAAGVKYSTTCSGANSAPVVYAGNDTAFNGTSIQITTATATDNVSVASLAWTKISGGTYSINNATIINPVFSGLSGDYVFQLAGTDSAGLTGTSTVSISASLVTYAKPTVTAPADFTITTPSTTVVGTATGVAGATITSTRWIFIDGPSQVSFSAQTSLTTDILNIAPGITRIALRATDNHSVKNRDTFSITYTAPTNVGPTATAVYHVTFSQRVIRVDLDGTSSFDDKGIVTYHWRQTSGPATVIADTSAQVTQVTGILSGTYIYELKVTDEDGLTSTYLLTIVVAPPRIHFSPKYGIQVP